MLGELRKTYQCIRVLGSLLDIDVSVFRVFAEEALDALLEGIDAELIDKPHDCPYRELTLLVCQLRTVLEFWRHKRRTVAS